MSIRYEYTDAADVPQYGDNPAMVSNGRGLRDVVEFSPNVPVRLSLKYAKPKPIETRRGPRVMFTTSDNRVAFLDRDIAFNVEKLELKPGEVFWLCRRNTGEKGSLDTWDVYLDPATERARAKIPEPPATTPTPVVGTPATQEVALNNSDSTQIHMGWAQLTLSTANTLSDIYAAALAHAQKHGGSVRNEDVRTMVVTAFIQQCARNGKPSHA